MDKLILHRSDFTQENIVKLAELFPNCFTENIKEDRTPENLNFQLLLGKAGS